MYAIDGEDLQMDQEYKVVLPAFVSEGKESNLGFMDTSAQYRPLNLIGVNGSSKNDLRDVTIKYLKSKTENWESCPN